MSRLLRGTCSLGPLPPVEISHPLIVGGTTSEGAVTEEEGEDSGEVGGEEEEGTELTGEEGEDIVVSDTSASLVEVAYICSTLPVPYISVYIHV